MELASCPECGSKKESRKIKCWKCGYEFNASEKSKKPSLIDEYEKEFKVNKWKIIFINIFKAVRRFLRLWKLALIIAILLLVAAVVPGQARSLNEVSESSKAILNSFVQMTFPESILKKRLTERKENIFLSCPDVKKLSFKLIGGMGAPYGSCAYKVDMEWLKNHASFGSLTKYRKCIKKFDAINALIGVNLDISKLPQEFAPLDRECSINLQADLIKDF